MLNQVSFANGWVLCVAVGRHPLQPGTEQDNQAQGRQRARQAVRRMLLAVGDGPRGGPRGEGGKQLQVCVCTSVTSGREYAYEPWGVGGGASRDAAGGVEADSEGLRAREGRTEARCLDIIGGLGGLAMPVRDTSR